MFAWKGISSYADNFDVANIQFSFVILFVINIHNKKF